MGKAQHPIVAANKRAALLGRSGLNFTTQGMFHHGFEGNPTTGRNAFGLNQQVIRKVESGLHMGEYMVLREHVKPH
jgi:hypothetical protein